MESRIRQICESSDQFWYPEINKQLKNPQSAENLNLDTLYTRKSATFCNEITTLVLKILHHLRMTISKTYRSKFEYNVEILISSEHQLKINIDLEKTKQQHQFNERVKERLAQRKHQESIEKQRYDKAIQAVKNFRRACRVRKSFLKLRDGIYRTKKGIMDESEIINILTQYRTCKQTVHDLDEKKPKGWIAFFKGESTDAQQTRKNTVENMKILAEQIKNHSCIGKKFKKGIEDQQNLSKIMAEIESEMQIHEHRIKNLKSTIEKARTSVYNLVLME